MSLINKMLQDLDARGGQPGPAAVSPEIRPVQAPERSFPWLRVALLGGLAVVLGGSGYLAWRIQQTTAVEVPVAAAPVSAPAPAAAPVAVQPVLAEAAPAPEPIQEPAQAQAEPAPAPPIPVEPKKAEPPVKKEAAAPKPVAARPEPAKPKAATPPKTTPAAAAGRVETTAQRAENAYRRGLASLEDGRVTEAMGHLQSALRADPRHEAARQTLVSLLIEARRPDEAIRQLGAALALDPRQPAMAMLLARLQLERGSPGIDTLMRTLPYASGSGEYRAFLAGALQREQRHREAVEHYTAALRTAPQNGVWWMGLGISLQAEKRHAEAADAYQKAQASGTLSAELQGFVERKLKQLAR
ncbi:tetratricopeptide repeat protein [Massilia sp. IC2-477]|uniref:tetratricopeptide repeat protein n=1 Tax=Massilia sp. IC2-477 TaxID=2887198 RepID=UPI001D11F76E|nr:tetratricopeptide repeat protein [Massilia sp. IC2-477]MCC2955383.1 tetratricopeptide repeat protein [Massilia sp. IC2-477]